MAGKIFRKTQEETHDDSGVVLLLQVPRTNDKKELAAEQMFASLHGLLTIPTPGVLKAAKRERLSFEIAVRGKRIGFYVWVPRYLCLLYTSPSPRDRTRSRMPSSA